MLAREFSGSPAERRSAFTQGRKAAFTLRLDEERHLRLRLACTAQNLSAQAVVTQALDKFLADNPELAAIAGELRRKRK
jgi:predicted HicB family RNase H-like nuclease